jgi:hypothetical protein
MTKMFLRRVLSIGCHVIGHLKNAANRKTKQLCAHCAPVRAAVLSNLHPGAVPAPRAENANDWETLGGFG